MAEKEKEIVSLQAKIQHATDESKVQKNDIERLRKRVSEQDNQIREMSNQLQQQQHYAEDLKENSLIKDAEVFKFSLLLFNKFLGLISLCSFPHLIHLPSVLMFLQNSGGHLMGTKGDVVPR